MGDMYVTQITVTKVLFPKKYLLYVYGTDDARSSESETAKEFILTFWNFGIATYVLYRTGTIRV